jgi:molybdenum cofactor biosynthesis enzyme MoaA
LFRLAKPSRHCLPSSLRDGRGHIRLNVGLDTLDPERFAVITCGADLSRVLTGLASAKAAGLAPIEINTLVMRGVNDAEIEAIIDFCGVHGFTLRPVETMPVGEAGRRVSDRYLPLDHRRLTQRGAYALSAMRRSSATGRAAHRRWA